MPSCGAATTSSTTTLPLRDRHNRLMEWLEQMHRALAAQPTDDPVLLALTDAQRTYAIPVGLLDQLAYGTAADLESSRAAASGDRSFEHQFDHPLGLPLHHPLEQPLVARYQRFWSCVSIVTVWLRLWD